MSGPVGVLDVMHDCAERLRTKGCFAFAADLDAARATVVELIEAVAAERNVRYRDYRGLHGVRVRIAAALARCRGEA